MAEDKITLCRKVINEIDNLKWVLDYFRMLAKRYIELGDKGDREEFLELYETYNKMVIDLSNILKELEDITEGERFEDYCMEDSVK